MKINQIFEKPVDRKIEGVIKADDLESLKLEVEEYVFTAEISTRLSNFFDAYNNYYGANGVWISGFFGSGKSHLLKMLALLLENHTVDGQQALEYFLPKCGDEAMLKGEMQQAVSIPSRSILFNIDQKADTISKTETDAVLSVFVKVFNEMCGYYGKQGYVAQFERDLDGRGQLAGFKRAYQDAAGISWETGREQIILEKQNIAQAYAQASGDSVEASLGIMDHYRSDYKVSIEDFAEMVQAYVETQEPGFRLNFFVDEVGQYVADNIKLMTNLQTIAESLATKCRGQSWVVVTAQDEIDKVLGEMKQREGTDFSKIQDRFKTRMKLTSANVDEVIQKRLLKKNARGETRLETLYQQERNNFGTLFDFSDGSIRYRGFRDEGHFQASYPFVPYQFPLFQAAIKNLSDHSAFEGRHSSVGERSMLGVFQQVVIEIIEAEIGHLATFDLMFEGIRTTLKSQIQSAVLKAEQHLENEFAVRVLKALFLVKYVKEFKATPRNLRVLLHGSFDQDFEALRNQIAEALSALEQQTYIQRNGEVYEFLTDEEKDVEQEIKNTEVDSGEVAQTLGEILFSDIVRDRKIRDAVTGQDFQFTKKLDDRQIGREQELAIHFVTPFYEHSDDITTLQANSMGRAELLVVLPSDDRLVRDLLMAEKTAKYVRLNQSSTQQDSVRRILGDKLILNTQRRKNIRDLVAGMVAKARLFAVGSEIETSSQDARTRVLTGFHELITSVYPNLRMLQGIKYNENEIGKYLKLTQNTMFSGDAGGFSEAEGEMLAFIQGNNRTGVRTTLKSLEEYFSRKPYGWYLAAIQCILAKLCGRGKVEVRSDGNLLEEAALERALRNTHGFPNVVLDPQIEFTASQVRGLKDFYNGFFDRPAGANEARALGKETSEAFKDLLHELETLAVRRDSYPFLTALDGPLGTLQDLVGKPYTFFLTDLRAQEDDFFDLKETVLDPLRRFMSGGSREIYDQAARFMLQQQPNFSALNSTEPQQLQAILDDPDCYRGDQIRSAKTLMDGLNATIQEMVASEREQAIQAVAALQTRLQAMDEFQSLNTDQQEALNADFEAFPRELQRQILIPVIRDAQRRFEADIYPQRLTQMTAWAQQAHAEEPGAVREKPPEYITRQSLQVTFNKAYLADEPDVDEYLAALREVMLQAISRNKRIQI